MSPANQQGEALLHAAASGDVKQIAQLLRAGANIAFRDHAPLRWAIRHQQVPAVEYLLNVGATLDGNEAEFVSMAAKQGDARTLALLLTRLQGKIEHAVLNSSLVSAVKADNAESVTLLLDAGADIDTANGEAWITSAMQANVALLRLLDERGALVCARDSLALFSGVFAGSIETVRYLLLAGVDVDARKGSPLLLALSSGKTEIMHELLIAGAQLPSPQGITALTHCDSLETLLYLVAHQPDWVNSCAHELAAEAANHAASKVLGYMLANYPVAQHILDEGLLSSVNKACPANIQLLLQYGANATADRSAAFRLAIQRGELELAKSFMAAGARVEDLHPNALGEVIEASDGVLVLELLQRGIAVEDVKLSPYNAWLLCQTLSPVMLFLDWDANLLPPSVRKSRWKFVGRIMKQAVEEPTASGAEIATWVADAYAAAGKLISSP